MVGLIVKTQYGEGELIDIHQSELGYLMVKLYFVDSKKYLTFNLGKKQIEITKENNLQITENGES